MANFWGNLKRKFMSMMFDRKINLKYTVGIVISTRRYYVSTVGLNEGIIKNYIQEQEKADLMLDKVRVKEYEDLIAPSRGSRGKSTR